MTIIRKGFNHFTGFVSKFDLFGKNITFTYNSSEIYQTFLGGIASVAITLTTMIYFVYICTDMSRGGYFKTSETAVDALDKPNKYDFGERGFEFALISTLPVEDLLDASIYSVDLTIYTFDRDDSQALVASIDEKPIHVEFKR